MEMDFSSDQPSDSVRSNIVPFGKYRGQPIESLAADPQYVNWLMNQEWFKSRNPSLYQIIINNFGEPEDTPEHNEMQACFLDRSFQEAFILPIIIETNPEIGVIDIKFESNGNDVEMCFDVRWKKNGITYPQHFLYVRGDEVEVPKEEFESKYTDRDRSRNGHIKTSEFFAYRYDHALRIEIKPRIGDNFPSTMRQMKRQKSQFLYVREYTGSGVKRDIFVQMFESQGLKVVFEKDVLDKKSQIEISNSL